MKGLNKAYLIGTVGRDVELLPAASGKPVVKVSLATPHARKIGEDWVDVPDWHRLTAFDRNAEYLANYARKGGNLAVECSIRPNKWTDRDNVTRYEVQLIVDRVLWYSGPKNGNPPAPPADTTPNTEEGSF